MHQITLWMASYTPLQVLLQIQLQDITPRHKLAALGLVSAAPAVASVLATPIAGALSDPTTHTRGIAHLRGRRHRWTLAMALLGADRVRGHQGDRGRDDLRTGWAAAS